MHAIRRPHMHPHAHPCTLFPCARKKINYTREENNMSMLLKANLGVHSNGWHFNLTECKKEETHMMGV